MILEMDQAKLQAAGIPERDRFRYDSAAGRRGAAICGVRLAGLFYPHLEVPARTSLEGRFGDEVRAGLRRRGHDVVNWQDYEFDAGGLAIAMDAAPRTGTGCWRSAPTHAESAMPWPISIDTA